MTAILTNYKARLDLLHLRLDTLPGIGQTAVSYALKLYSNMEKWRDDPDYEIDNNFAERAARPVAMHRKTQNHVASHKGAEASCILRSLIETCKLWKVSMCEYLNKIFTAFSVGRTDYENLRPLGLTIKTSNFASESQSYDLLTPSFNLRDLNHTNQINKKIVVL